MKTHFSIAVSKRFIPFFVGHAEKREKLSVFKNPGMKTKEKFYFKTENTKNAKMPSRSAAKINHDIEEIYKQIGEFGPYQLFLCVLIGFVSFVPAVVAYGYSFYAATPKHRCKIPNLINDTYELWHGDHQFHKEMIDKYIPHLPDNKCNLKFYPNETQNSSGFYELRKCNEWVYSKDYFDSTITSDVNSFSIVFSVL